MFTLKQAKEQAAMLSDLHGEDWIVFKTPADAACNQRPLNMFNSGRDAVCPANERDDYAAGGAEFV